MGNNGHVVLFVRWKDKGTKASLSPMRKRLEKIRKERALRTQGTATRVEKMVTGIFKLS
jgi:hypothetical protein